MKYYSLIGIEVDPNVSFKCMCLFCVCFDWFNTLIIKTITKLLKVYHKIMRNIDFSKQMYRAWNSTNVNNFVSSPTQIIRWENRPHAEVFIAFVCVFLDVIGLLFIFSLSDCTAAWSTRRTVHNEVKSFIKENYNL